jgi:hypothetical protein
MNLTDAQKLDIILTAMHTIGSYEVCDCGRPNNRKARIAGKPVHTWYIANEALKAVGEEIKIYENCTN